MIYYSNNPYKLEISLNCIYCIVFDEKYPLIAYIILELKFKYPPIACIILDLKEIQNIFKPDNNTDRKED